MHIDDQSYTVNKKKYRRVLLRNSYRKNGKTCHDTIANLSKCSNDEIEAMKWALAHKNDLKVLERRLHKSTKTRQGLGVGSVWLLHQLAKRIGLGSALGSRQEAKRCLWMVIAAVMGCTSRLSATRLAQRHAACDILGLDDFCEDDLYSAMNWLTKNQSKIERRLFSHRYKKSIPTIYLYDVTSSYLEGDKNELGDYGYNRDRKRGKKQIVIGLLTDEAGYPISCEVFRGNTQDPKTFKNQIDKIKERFGAEHVTFVGDRGMIKNPQVKQLHSDEHTYITAITKPQIQALLTNDVLQMELFDENVCEIQDGLVRYILRRNPLRAEELQQTRLSKLAKLNAFLEKKNEYLRSHSRAKLEVALRNVNALAKKLKIESWVTIQAEGRTMTSKIDDAELKSQAKLDGCYVIKTNLPVESATAQTVHDRYCDLTEVEWAFRTMKTTLLHIRGIFVQKESRTRAHVFIIMLSYLLAYELRRLWGTINVTIPDGIEELSSLCATEVLIENGTIQTIPEPRPLGKSLLEAAQVVLPDAIPSRHSRVHTRKNLIEERRTYSK